ncbi:MAG TPA: hypothetical protein VFR38_10665 [Gaiellaceae bacterium]|nr:hypothetical protein [Gaiellaceae bacterium]
MNPRPQRPARYAVVFRIGLGARAAGALVIDQDRLQLEGRTADGPVELSVPYAELVEVWIARGPEELVNGRPALLLAREDGPPVQVEPFGIGLLHELADLLVALAAEHADGGEEVAVIVPLKKDRMAQAKELVVQGPPFDPAALGLTRHEVFLTADKAIFVFAGPHVRATLERMTRDPTLWRVGIAWRACIGGRPRLAAASDTRPGTDDQPVYSWAANGGRSE